MEAGMLTSKQFASALRVPPVCFFSNWIRHQITPTPVNEPDAHWSWLQFYDKSLLEFVLSFLSTIFIHILKWWNHACWILFTVTVPTRHIPQRPANWRHALSMVFSRCVKTIGLKCLSPLLTREPVQWNQDMELGILQNINCFQILQRALPSKLTIWILYSPF